MYVLYSIDKQTIESAGLLFCKSLMFDDASKQLTAFDILHD
jgi:hypothetical protein